ncbi:hypothetical protein B4107_0948 [Bacillus safensis]|nr:hypothetical protein B4107_0948 [Bacillus safensis]
MISFIVTDKLVSLLSFMSKWMKICLRIHLYQLTIKDYLDI